MNDKTIVDFTYENNLLFRLGKASYTKAKRPLGIHNHGGMTEIVFMIKGCQEYQINDKNYCIESGQYIIAYPEEWHGTGGNPEDKAVFYYLIINLNEICNGNFCFCKSDAKRWEDIFTRIPRAGDTGAGHYCQELMKMCGSGKSLEMTRVRNCLSQMLTEFVLKEMKRSGHSPAIERVLKYIEKHIEEEINLDVLADILNVSISRFRSSFTEQVGIPPREYILRKKLEECTRELENTKKTATEIAFAYSFSSSQYFSTVFKKYYCVTPSEYRERRRHDK